VHRKKPFSSLFSRALPPPIGGVFSTSNSTLHRADETLFPSKPLPGGVPFLLEVHSLLLAETSLIPLLLLLLDPLPDFSALALSPLPGLFEPLAVFFLREQYFLFRVLSPPRRYFSYFAALPPPPPPQNPSPTPPKPPPPTPPPPPPTPTPHPHPPTHYSFPKRFRQSHCFGHPLERSTLFLF